MPEEEDAVHAGVLSESKVNTVEADSKHADEDEEEADASHKSASDSQSRQRLHKQILAILVTKSLVSLLSHFKLMQHALSTVAFTASMTEWLLVSAARLTETTGLLEVGG